MHDSLKTVCLLFVIVRKIRLEPVRVAVRFVSADRVATWVYRSKLVFLISIIAVIDAHPWRASIMGTIKCLKGVRWMPWQ